MASNLVKNHMSKIVSKIEKDHLLKRPNDAKLARGVADGFYSAINKLKEMESVKQ